MLQKRVMWVVCLWMALLMASTGATAEGENTQYQLEGFVVSVPASWQAEGDGSGGMLRWSFVDGSNPGICVMTVSAASGGAGLVSTEDALQQVALSMGAGAYTMETLGGREVLLCDLKQGDSQMAGAIFMEAAKVVVVMTRLTGSVSAIRQQEIAISIVEDMQYDENAVTEESEITEPTPDENGNMRYPVSGLTLTVPADWTVLNEDIEGQLQLQFTDAAVTGVCVMVPRLVGAVEADQVTETLSVAAQSMGAINQETTTIDGREVLLCEVQPSGQTVSAALFIEGNHVVVLTVALIEADHVSRQRDILQSLVPTVKSAKEP